MFYIIIIYSIIAELDDLQPIKTSDKRSYNQSQLVWIKEAGLQADIQKILRQARKMPDKISSFYKVEIKFIINFIYLFINILCLGIKSDSKSCYCLQL